MAATHVVRPVSAFTRAPKGWSHPEAATITTAGLTAWRALVVDGVLQAGQTVLTMGAGGVSIAALQLAKAMGAHVVATSSSDEKRERLRALGADHTINYKTTPEWGSEVLRLTGGEGVSHVVETGGPGTLPQSVRATRVGGRGIWRLARPAFMCGIRRICSLIPGSVEHAAGTDYRALI